MQPHFSFAFLHWPTNVFVTENAAELRVMLWCVFPLFIGKSRTQESSRIRLGRRQADGQWGGRSAFRGELQTRLKLASNLRVVQGHWFEPVLTDSAVQIRNIGNSEKRAFIVDGPSLNAFVIFIYFCRLFCRYFSRTNLERSLSQKGSLSNELQNQPNSPMMSC